MPAPGGLYRGRVIRTDSDGHAVITIPALGHQRAFRQVARMVPGDALEDGERIIVGSVGTSRDEVVVIGRLTTNAYGDWVEPIAELTNDVIDGLAALGARIDTTNLAATALSNRVATVESIAALNTSNLAAFSASTTSALATKLAASARGAASGVASLDANTKVPIAQLPVGTAAGTVSAGDRAYPTTFRGAWAATTVYAVDDAVTANGFRWLCRVPHTSGSSFSPTNWVCTGSVRQTSVGPYATSNFVTVYNNTTLPLASVTVPAQPYAWRPRVSGVIEAQVPGGSVLGIYARLGTTDSGTIVGRAAIGGMDATQQAVLQPYFLIPSVAATQGPDVIPGNIDPGIPQTITLFLARDYGPAAVRNTTLLPYFQVWVDFL